jgi:putative nucleotidyltransferase with HDIG domain
MPTLDRAGRRYVSVVVLAGLGVLGQSVWTMLQNPPSVYWLILVCLTLLAALVTLRIPTVPVSFSISDTFTITGTLLFGAPVGTLLASLDGFVLSYHIPRDKRTLTQLVFNAAAPAVAMWLAATGFFWLIGAPTLLTRRIPFGTLALPLAGFAASYFLLNTGLVARAVAYERRINTWAFWREHFVPLWLSYFGATSLAALQTALVYGGSLDASMLIVAAPLPIVLYLTFKHALGRIEDHVAHFAEVSKMYLATIETLAHAIDAKDQVTHGHIRRVQRQAVRLAREIGVTDEHQIKAIEAASLLHDTGKLAIPEHILNKPGRLTPAEFEIMKRHAPIGAEILSTIDFPYPVVPIVRHHHENWDGTGYPDGLHGDEIPVGARILSVVDCFDALTSDRPYRPRLSRAAALEILRERRGWMYDPKVVDAFMRLADELIVEDQRDEAPRHSDRMAVISGSIHAFADADRRGEADVESERLRTALAVGRALESRGGTDAAIAALLSALRARAHVTDAALLLVNGADALYTASAAGVNATSLRGLRLRIGEGVSGWVAANAQPMLNADPRLDLQGRVAGSGEPPQSMLAVPVISGAQPVGVLALYSVTPSAFTDADLRLAAAVAQAVGERMLSDARL